ncbi:13656_t:CDS:2 [Entrophospora sp. SA101]|nr:13656_t:CDS:2 [Entrophospora sp. SA101]
MKENEKNKQLLSPNKLENKIISPSTIDYLAGKAKEYNIGIKIEKKHSDVSLDEQQLKELISVLNEISGNLKGIKTELQFIKIGLELVEFPSSELVGWENYMLPILPLLEKVGRKIMSISNRQKESKREVHYGLFLLGYKSGLRVSEAEIELTPHTLRRTFTTYHAENGIPLPLLQKLLGHSSIRTTALYWRNIYGDGNNDTADILAGKKWLENKGKRPPTPIAENFASPKVDTFPEIPKNSESLFIDQRSIIPKKKIIQQDNPPLLTEIKEKPITNYQSQPLISEIPSQTPRIIKSKKEPQNQKENILLVKIRNLEERLKQIQTENNNLKSLVQSEKQNNQLSKETITNLTHKIQSDKPNHTNLINAYQKAFNDKVKAEIIVKQEKQRADNYQQQLKTITKKIKHCQQIEQEQEIKAQIEQLPS